MALNEDCQNNILRLLLEKICFWLIYAISSSLILIDSSHNQVLVFHILAHQGGKHAYVTINSLSAVPSSTICILCMQTLYTSFLCVYSMHVENTPLMCFLFKVIGFQSSWYFNVSRWHCCFFSEFRIIHHNQPARILCFSFY